MKNKIWIILIAVTLSVFTLNLVAQPGTILDIIEGKTELKPQSFPAQSLRLMPYLSFQFDFVLTEAGARSIKKSEIFNMLLSRYYGTQTWKVIADKFGGKLRDATGKHPGIAWFSWQVPSVAVDPTKPNPLWGWHYRSIDNTFLAAVKDAGGGNYYCSFASVFGFNKRHSNQLK